MSKVTKAILKKVYVKRPLNARKYDFGNLIIIGGSEFYSGSPALSAMAAFKAGVDMVRIIAPERAANIIASFSPNMAAYPLRGDNLSRKHLATLLSMAESAKAVAKGKAAVVIGGGAGRTADTQETILEFLSQVSIPAVIDADAIHSLAKNPRVVSGKNFLITPHEYEFFVLTKTDVKGKSDKQKIEIVKSAAKRLDVTILLKGKTDIISNGKDVALDTAGTSYLSVGGTGDSMAGICGALLARGLNAFDVAQAAAYINGKAGELAGKELKESMTATDLIEKIPEIIN